jgi:hypothetical protein
MMNALERGLRLALGTIVLCGALLVGAGAAAAAPPSTCSGSLSDFPNNLGVLSGTYGGNVQVSGACAVVAGPTEVKGNLILAPGSTLLAAFGETDFRPGSPASTLTVDGNVLVQNGATLVLGCYATSFPCLDDPSSDNPTLDSPATVHGNLMASGALGVIVHDTTVDGNVMQNGGGGGFGCDQTSGIFGIFGFPAYSDYEDSAVGGNLGVSGLQSCWLGMARDHVGKNMLVQSNQLADPDAIEVLSNTISGNLVCQQNSMLWDSVDLSESGLYPRGYEPNTVGGRRIGQCVVAPPIDTPNGPSSGPF